jgi:NAD(P)-dependent dehydrogenase (short-subunit alcohol dehydrogenase family)
MTKVVIVTGAGRGIGRAIAESFADIGYSVVIADRDESAGNQSAGAITGREGRAIFVKTDVSVPSDTENLIKITVDEYKRVDVLVNNAGFGIWMSPDKISVEEWDSVINTNLRGAFLCSREAAKIMRSNDGGTIINIASTRAFMSEPHSEAYAASKGGIVSLTHSLAASYSKDKIRVNCISPGWIETGDYSSLRKIDHEQHFSGRVGKPADIAAACHFIVNSEFLNGENIIIDGGMTRKMMYES